MGEPRIVIIGAGLAGIATAYYLVIRHGIRDIRLVDAMAPMAFTSAQSGDNYRNWWPHPSMVALSTRSIDLMEDIARTDNNRIAMTRRGYALATRRTHIDDWLEELRIGFADNFESAVRFHPRNSATYRKSPRQSNWQDAPEGIDVLCHRDVVSKVFPSFDKAINTVIHVRRAGAVDGYQLGTYMLDVARSEGARVQQGTVVDIDPLNAGGFTLFLDGPDGHGNLFADRIVNAAGPFAGEIAGMLGICLPVINILQQKMAFDDVLGTVPRDLPFSVDLDEQALDWSPATRALLAEDVSYGWLTQVMPGGVHCRPEGASTGCRVKLGWAYNASPAPPAFAPHLDPHFPEIVLRAAARLQPSLKAYNGQPPQGTSHYGGWYTMTEENWPLVGPMTATAAKGKASGADVEAFPHGAYMVCALSGFGTMCACACGELCAAWVAGAPLPAYAPHFSLARYADAPLMRRLRGARKGIL